MRRRFFNNNINNFDINDYLTIEALEDNLQVYFPYEDLMYALDGLGWQKLVAGKYSPAISKGQTISFKGNVASNGVNKPFIITKRCNLLGNCMSLASPDALGFCGLFANCSTIVSVSKDFLPATTLASDCYKSMFCNCKSLEKAPELPATTLADSCYYGMFEGCTSLTEVPVLPATTLTSYCYSYMFYGCTNLNYIKMLATDVSATDCLYHWVSGVSPTGTFVKSKDATWDVVGVNGVPTGWTVITNDQEGESGSGLEFPIYLEFDSCKAIDKWSTACVRNPDEISIKLRDYFVQIAVEYGSNVNGIYTVTEQKLDLLGVEVYIDSQKVSYYIYDGSRMILYMQSVYESILFREDCTLYFEGML